MRPVSRAGHEFRCGAGKALEAFCSTGCTLTPVRTRWEDGYQAKSHRAGGRLLRGRGDRIARTEESTCHHCPRPGPVWLELSCIGAAAFSRASHLLSSTHPAAASGVSRIKAIMARLSKLRHLQLPAHHSSSASSRRLWRHSLGTLRGLQASDCVFLCNKKPEGATQ